MSQARSPLAALTSFALLAALSGCLSMEMDQPFPAGDGFIEGAVAEGPEGDEAEAGGDADEGAAADENADRVGDPDEALVPGDRDSDSGDVMPPPPQGADGDGCEEDPLAEGGVPCLDDDEAAGDDDPAEEAPRDDDPQGHPGEDDPAQDDPAQDDPSDEDDAEEDPVEEEPIEEASDEEPPDEEAPDGELEDDEFEPNDGPQDATPIEPGMFEGLTITEDDEDWFAVAPCAGGTIHFAVEALPANDGDAPAADLAHDLDVLVLDGAGGEVASFEAVGPFEQGE